MSSTLNECHVCVMFIQQMDHVVYLLRRMNTWSKIQLPHSFIAPEATRPPCLCYKTVAEHRQQSALVVLLNGNLTLKEPKIKTGFHSRCNLEMRPVLADSLFVVTVSEHVNVLYSLIT